MYYVCHFTDLNSGLTDQGRWAVLNSGVAYHYALKKIVGLPKRYSNHIVCRSLGVFKLKHLMNLQLFKFCLWLNNCESPCFVRHKTYFMRMSRFRATIDAIALRDYSFGDVIDNDYDAIIARIMYVQNSEESNLFTGL